MAVPYPHNLRQQVLQALLAMQRLTWEQGVAAQAAYELGEHELLIHLAEAAVMRQDDLGRLALVESRPAFNDPAANGEPVLRAGQLAGRPDLLDAAQLMLDYLLHHAPCTDDGTLYHHPGQMWIDAMYMTPPFLAVAGHPTEAVCQADGLYKRLWRPEKQLFGHIWDESAGQFADPSCWGIGNGWAAAGLTRLLGSLPASMADERARLTGYLVGVLDGCLALQRPDGLFHNLVDDPSTFVETNLAQMLAYSIYRSIAGGWLDEAYRPDAGRMRRAVYAKVTPAGLVEGVCAAPDFNRPGLAPEGQAFFLLMEAAADAAGAPPVE